MKKFEKSKELSSLVADPHTPHITPVAQESTGESPVIPVIQDETQTSAPESDTTIPHALVVEEVEEAIEEVVDDLIPNGDIILQVLQEADDKEEGFSDPFFIFQMLYRVPDSLPRDLNIHFESQFEYRLFLQIFEDNEETIEEICCVRDLPITLIFNGTLIYTHNGFQYPTLTSMYNSNGSYGAEKDCCCCELPPAPEPNYWFTYTNCDGEAYVDLYIKERKDCYCDNEEIQTEISALNTVSHHSAENSSGYESEYGDCVQHYRIEFLPGFEPECGCNLSTVFSNLLTAESIYDFVDPYINNPDYSPDGIDYQTHFIDDCGVCWSIVLFNQPEYGIASENGYCYEPIFYLVPICAAPVEFDSICIYYYQVDNEFGEYSYYSNDGYYEYQNLFDRTIDQITQTVAYNISVDVDISFIEINGDSFLSFNFDQYWQVIVDGNPTTDFEQVQLIVDVPDGVDFEEGAIEQFILCSQKYYDNFFPEFAKFASIATEELESTGGISLETALSISTLFLESYAQNMQSCSCDQPGYGVLEDVLNNVYGLCYDGEINTTPFVIPPFNVESNTYLTDVELCDAAEAEIINIPLEICYCDEAMVERFETWQQEVCDSAYGNPFLYVSENLNAHYVNDGKQAYLEINYNEPLLYTQGCEGYSEAVQKSIRICIDDCEIKDITKLCIDTQALFENYYENGYVDFEELFSAYNSYAEENVFLKDDCGNCYVINPTQSQDALVENGYEEERMFCDLELEECECKEKLDVKLINTVEQVSEECGKVTIDVHDSQYNLNFSFVHNSYGTFLEICYSYFGVVEQPTTDKAYLDITGTDLDCCCGLEYLVLDAEDLYEFTYNYYQEEEGEIISLDDFLYYFSTEGNLNLYDCDGNCYNIVNTYDGAQLPPEFEVQPCNDEECTEQRINVELEDPYGCNECQQEQLIPMITVGEEEPNNTECFDQFFDFTLICCNDLSYINFTWYYNQNSVYTIDSIESESVYSQLPTPQECFNFPIYSNSILISIPDELDICDCPIESIIIPADAQCNYEQYFQDCCTLSDYNNYQTGYDLIESLSCDRALLVSECENYIIDKSCVDGSYVLVAVGDVLRVTTFTDENYFGTGYMPTTYTNDLNLASQDGDGLSLREAIILSNLYDTEVDSILLESGTYTLTIENVSGDEDESATGDLDVLNNVAIVGGCYGSRINANYIDRALEVGNNYTLDLRNLTIVDGYIGAGTFGGGIFLNTGANLNLYNTDVTDNFATYGAGIYAESLNTITLYACSDITYNGTYDEFGYLTTAGGGIYVYDGTVILNDDSTIENNQAYYGGGIYATGGVLPSGSTIILNDESHISYNTAEIFGGGIYANNGSVTLNDDSHISSNTANLGGGIYDFDQSTISLNNNGTITLNTANTGAGIYQDNVPPTTTINNPGNVNGNINDDIAPPLVLDLNHDNEITLISAQDSQAYWDVNGDGDKEKTGWVGPEDGLLIYDYDNDGLVTDASEFILASHHPHARTDMEGMLLAFDSNHDGIFDMQDEHYDDFGVWQDKDSDGITDEGEFGSLVDWNIASISLNSDQVGSINEGNTIFGSSTYSTMDGESYRVADVGLSIPSMADVIEPDDIVPNSDTSISQTSEPTTSEYEGPICVPPPPVANDVEEVQAVCAG